VIFTEPIDFDAALQQIDDKTIIESGLSHAQQQALPEQFNARGMFSARTMNGQLLGGYQNELKQLISQENIATARVKMKDLIDQLDIVPPSANEAGTITDLGSDSRIELILRTNLEMARGKGQYDEGMTEGALVAFPALELIRVEERAVPREWFDIWDDAADELGDETTATDADETGRMVAVKGDPIWLAISDFEQPYPPFKFNSGMGVEDVDRDDAIDLGVIDEDEIPDPKELDFNDGVESGVNGIDPQLVGALADDLKGVAKLVGNAFQMLTTKTPPKPLSNDARAIRARVHRVLELFGEAA
jgi:hypothetical protein